MTTTADRSVTSKELEHTVTGSDRSLTEHSQRQSSLSVIRVDTRDVVAKEDRTERELEGPIATVTDTWCLSRKCVPFNDIVKPIYILYC